MSSIPPYIFPSSIPWVSYWAWEKNGVLTLFSISHETWRIIWEVSTHDWPVAAKVLDIMKLTKNGVIWTAFEESDCAWLADYLSNLKQDPNSLYWNDRGIIRVDNINDAIREIWFPFVSRMRGGKMGNHATTVLWPNPNKGLFTFTQTWIWQKPRISDYALEHRAYKPKEATFHSIRQGG